MKWKSKDKGMTTSQQELIVDLFEDIHEYDPRFDLMGYCRDEFGKSPKKLSINEASDLIKFLIAERRYLELIDSTINEIY